MPLYQIKLVPDAEPNADGTWHTAGVPLGFQAQDFWNWAAKPGFHIVDYRSHDPQNGGPMHANHLPQPYPEFVWSMADRHDVG